MINEESKKDFTSEAIVYLKIEVPKLNDAQYNNFTRMIGSTPQQINLQMAENMIHRVKSFQLLEEIMYTGEEFSLYEQFTPEAIEYLKQEIKKMNDWEIDNLENDLRMRAFSKRDGEININDAESFVYMAKYPDEVEALAFGNLGGNWRY